jgi:hypothetical protein
MGKGYRTHGEEEERIKDFGGKRKGALGRARHRQEHNVGMDLRETMGCFSN